VTIIVVPVRSVSIERDRRSRVTARIAVGYRQGDEERIVFVSTPDVEAAAMLARQLVEGPATWAAPQAVLDAAFPRGAAI
jgi:hypothetical protein